MFGEILIHPALIMFVGAGVIALLPQATRSAAFILISGLALVSVWTLQTGLTLSVDFLQFTLVLLKVDRLSWIFGIIFSLIAVCGGVYAYHIKDRWQQVAALLYAGSAIGVTFAGDYITLFFFWEVMALASTVLVWSRGSTEAANAGFRYLLVHLAGGSILLGGIFVHVHSTGSTLLTSFAEGSGWSAWLILIGVALNAAIPPLHSWLSDAYPRATVTGAVFLSAFTTKSAVYVLARLFPGWEILLVLGVIMAVYGVVFAVLANDIREILAYHIISQVGYMVAGVGIGTTLALNGTTAHAFSHILYKALLFMGAGVVLHTTGKSKLTELGGLGKAMPVIFWLYMIGAFSISGFPLFNGFISKSMVVAAAGEAHLNVAMMLLNLASVGTFLHTGLKLPYFTWFSEARGLQPTATPSNMYVGMALVAFLCMLFGVAPSLLYQYLPFAASYEPYTVPHLVEATQLLSLTFVGFWVLRRKLAGEPTITLDTDWFYRWPRPFVQRSVVDSVDFFFDWVEARAIGLAHQLSRISKNPIPSMRKLFGRQVRVVGSYDADRDRPPLGSIIGIILLCLVVASLVALWSW